MINKRLFCDYKVSINEDSPTLAKVAKRSAETSGQGASPSKCKKRDPTLTSNTHDFYKCTWCPSRYKARSSLISHYSEKHCFSYRNNASNYANGFKQGVGNAVNGKTLPTILLKLNVEDEMNGGNKERLVLISPVYPKSLVPNSIENKRTHEAVS